MFYNKTMHKILDLILAFFTSVFVLAAGFILLISSCVSSCVQRNKSAYGVKWTNSIGKKEDVNIIDDGYEKIRFQKGHYHGEVSLEFNPDKKDFFVKEITFSQDSFSEEPFYSAEVEQECKEFVEKYYFLYEEKMLEVFPPENTTALEYSQLIGYRYHTFKQQITEDSYQEFNYNFRGDFLILCSTSFHSESSHEPVLYLSKY